MFLFYFPFCFSESSCLCLSSLIYGLQFIYNSRVTSVYLFIQPRKSPAVGSSREERALAGVNVVRFLTLSHCVLIVSMYLFILRSPLRSASAARAIQALSG